MIWIVMEIVSEVILVYGDSLVMQWAKASVTMVST